MIVWMKMANCLHMCVLSINKYLHMLKGHLSIQNEEHPEPWLIRLYIHIPGELLVMTHIR